MPRSEREIVSPTGDQKVYYNEFDPFAAAWLEELIAAGQLPSGFVDRRDICDVRSSDLGGFVQCHFFAGIGGWPLALRLAGWPDTEPVWTGSCPCQPLSSAGQRKGHADERHLWPAFHRLIAECAPPIVFGEQVASKDGREWFAAVRTDLEDLGYACGAADLCAAGVGAPHIRQRLFFVAHAEHGASRVIRKLGAPQSEGVREIPREGPRFGIAGDNRPNGELAHTGRERRRQVSEEPGRRGEGSDAQGLVERPLHGSDGELGDAGRKGSSARERPELSGTVWFDEGRAAEQPSRSPWADLIWLHCRDGKARPTQSGILPLAHGVPNRVGTLRGAGNAIVPKVAAIFIEAVMVTAIGTPATTE